MIGIPPPPDMPEDCQASWYWDEICDAVAAHELGRHIIEGPIEYYADCQPVQDLIMGAVEAGVVGHLVPVAGFAKPQRLHSLVAPYRRRPGGLAEREDAIRRQELHRPVPRRHRAGDPA